MRNWKKWLSILLMLLLMAAPLAAAAEELPLEMEASKALSEAPAVLPLDPETELSLSDIADEEPAVFSGAEYPDANATLTLNVTELKLGIGERFDLIPTITDLPEDQVVEFHYSSSNAKIATVSDEGSVKGVKRGETKITVTASNGLSATCTVTVLKKPESIRLNPKSAKLGYDSKLGLGMTCQITATLSRNSASHLTYSGYDANVVDVSQSGLVTAKCIGSTKVKVSTYNGKSASFSVKVLPAPSSITLNETDLTLSNGETFQLKVTLPEGTASSGSFYSSDPDVVSVDEESGLMRAEGIGEAVVTARCFNDVSAECRVTVPGAADRVILSETSRTIGAGETFTLVATLVRDDGIPVTDKPEFTSSLPKKVKVSSSGKVTGLKKGYTATITASAPGGASADCTVKVVRPPASITVTPAKNELMYDPETGEGESTQLTVELSKGSASAITYSGYDEEVLQVSDSGLVVAVGAGTTTITASTYNNRKSSCTIRVVSPGQGKTVNVAHRGGAGYWPENTLEAFRNTASTGADAVELDVRSTKDGIQVIHHDEYFTVSGKKRYISREKYSSLKAWKPSLCTLDEALDVIHDSGLEMHLELKPSANVSKVVKAVAEHNMKNRTMYISFEKSLLSQVRSKDSKARIGYIINKTPSGLKSTLKSLKAEAVFQKKDYLTVSNMLAWQNSGLRVGVWTIDDKSTIQYWVSQGVDYLTSNYPKLTTEVLNEMN